MRIELIGEPKNIMSNPLSKHQYFGWPSVARLRDGKIVAAASGFRIGHIGPFGKAVISYSLDGGESFTPPAPVIDTVLDDRDAGLCPFGKSGLIVTSFNGSWVDELRKLPDQCYTDEEEKYKQAYLDTVLPEEEKAVYGGTFRISHDNGITFGPLHTIKISSPHGPIELNDGTILWVGESRYGGSDHLRIEAHTVNTDDGSTERIGIIDDIIVDGKVVPVYEPYACQLSDGRIICHIRTHVPHINKELGTRVTTYQCESTDGGRTWTKPECIIEMDEPDGSTMHIIEHSSGVVIASYAHRSKSAPPQGIRIMFSYDGGRSWDKHHTLYNISPEIPYALTGDIGYPMTAELPDGSLLTVFYTRVNAKSSNILCQKWRMSEK